MRVFFSLINIFFIASLFAEMPWGKDSELVYKKHSKEQKCSDSLARLGIYLIRFHKEVISPADGPRSNFIPNSSQYTLDAMKKYGFFRGITYGCDRLMRENSAPWIYPLVKDSTGKIIKHDPVN